MVCPDLFYDWDEEAFFWGCKGEKNIGFHFRVLRGRKYRVKLLGEQNWETVNLEQFVEMLRKVVFEVMS